MTSPKKLSIFVALFRGSFEKKITFYRSQKELKLCSQKASGLVHLALASKNLSDSSHKTLDKKSNV